MRNYVRKRNRKGKGKTPEVLWKLFGKRARTLAKAITSLMFPHSCQRKHDHTLCLQCRNAMSYLITPLDPHPYRELLHSCFVVFNDNAPPIGEFSTENRWSQHEVNTWMVVTSFCFVEMSSNAYTVFRFFAFRLLQGLLK